MRVFPGLSSMTLGVRSVEHAAVFYEKLGWKRSDHSSRAVAVFELNNLLLFLRPADALARDLRASALAGLRGFCAHTQNYGNGPAVHAVLEQARTAGAQILRDATIETFGRRTANGTGLRGAFADPDGHVWDIVHDPRLIPAPDGSLELKRKVTR